jgi:NADPH:quinone reductase-like Zn-dependent oxidoreductase
MTQDVLIAMGFLDSQPMGLEGSGVVEAVGKGVTEFQVGDSVFYLHRGALATQLRIPWTSCSKNPPGLTWEQAASMPTVALTAIHCIMDLGRLQKGESVLIHSACGGRKETCLLLVFN